MTLRPMPVRQSPVPAGIGALHRAELLAAIQGFEYALAAPADPAWHRCFSTELARLRAAFDTHVDLTEGPDGLYAQVLTDAPRLVCQVYRLSREHALVAATFECLAGRLDAEPERLRCWGGGLLAELSRHRQRGANLVYEAYATDIGGET
jgi:hypothetical protein